MLRQRVITAVILLIIVIGSLLISPLAFTAVAAFATGACLWEWLRLCRWNSIFAMVCSAFLAIAFFWLEYANPPALSTVQSGNGLMILTGLATVIWVAITALIFTRRMTGWHINLTIGWISAWFIMPAAWFSLMYLYRTGGALYMVSVLSIVWIADIMAYFGGSFFRGPKMAVGISPKKTWSGAATGFVSVIVIAYILYLCLPNSSLWSNSIIKSTTVWASFVILGLSVIFSISGDLWESALKRSANIKDSSNLLPGHGGFFDRLDAQLSVLPLSVFILLFLQGF